MKKLSLLLASIGAGLLLVGGTVAAYIVTAADQLGVRVSPGSIDTDKTGRVTLSWDTNTTHPVGNLVPGTETEVGQVKLAADAPEVQEFENYTGHFNVTLTNLSKGNTRDLLNYLEVKVYKSTSGQESGYPETGTAFPSPEANTDGYLATAYDDITAVSGYLYKVTVKLTASAGDDFYPDLLTQTAYATFDWGPASGDIDERDLATVYYAVNPLATGHELYAHIYKGNAAAADYPGLKMTYVYDIAGGKQLYSASFDRNKYDSFKFIDVTTEAKTQLAQVTKQFVDKDANPYYNGTEWATKPAEDLALYYVRGEIGGTNYWSTNEKSLALRQNPEKETEYLILDLALHANDEIKIYKPSEDKWFGPSEGNYLITEDGTYTVCFEYGHEDGGGWVNGMGVFKQ